MNRTTLPAQVFVIGLLAVIGCDNETATVAEPVTSTPPAAAPSSVVPDVKPVYTLEIKTSEGSPKTTKVVWTAQVNTGGWAMTTESVLVEDVMGKMTARVFAILEKPAPGDMTTQAIETLTGVHDAGEVQIDAAELSIKQVTRGDTSAIRGYYVIVKQAKN